MNHSFWCCPIYRPQSSYQAQTKFLCSELLKNISISVQASCQRKWSSVWLQYTAGSVVQNLQILKNISHLLHQGHQLMSEILDMELARRGSGLAHPWLKFLGYQLIKTISLVHHVPSIVTGVFLIKTKHKNGRR